MNRNSKKQARGFELIESEKVLGIKWGDGSKSRFELEELRRSCPCAQCKEVRLNRSEEGDGLNILVGDELFATSEVAKIEFVGRYGIKIQWADGHDHGIYTFEYFRTLDPKY
tara:strand:+ start:640 stop:975 length:336 start_codon:yes stop_codon:yes gene_type:complete